MAYFIIEKHAQQKQIALKFLFQASYLYADRKICFIYSLNTIL
jgi:hypothetical protein